MKVKSTISLSHSITKSLERFAASYLHLFASLKIERSMTVYADLYLPGLSHSVCGGKYSQPSFVTSWVPHGTVLGPLLFLHYSNDLPDNLKSSIRLFADDALLYGVMTNEEDGDQLQEDLQQLEVRQCKWQMVFNPTKCKTICISTKKTPPQRKYSFF